MEKGIDAHVFTGMKRDVEPAKQETTFLWDALNVRMTARDGDTAFAITNERGPLYKCAVSGHYMGHCVLGTKSLILFTTDETDPYDNDFIYHISLDDNGNIATRRIFEGYLGFSLQYPIQAVPMYEDELNQKVYWIDGKHQPRMLNLNTITSNGIIGQFESDYDFDFVPALELNDTLVVTPLYNGNGKFACGVIQYCFTYFNQYGTQTNIVDTSRLYNVAFSDRGGKPDETSTVSFQIRIYNRDSNYNHLRLYSIQRTSLNGTPIVRVVQDVSLANSQTQVTILDDGIIGYVINAEDLLLAGGEPIVPQTITAKDGTLFFGNIKLDRAEITETINAANITIRNTASRQRAYMSQSQDTSYNWFSTLDTHPGFKVGEHYRLGVQFQHKTGKWSDPVFLQDHTMTRNNFPEYVQQAAELQLPAIEVVCTDTNFIRSLKKNGYLRARPVVVFPEIQDRLVLTQGMLCPTVFNALSRHAQLEYAQSSWFIRPNNYKDEYVSQGSFASTHTLFTNINEAGVYAWSANTASGAKSGAIVQFLHNRTLLNMHSFGCEIQGSFKYKEEDLDGDPLTSNDKYVKYYDVYYNPWNLYKKEQDDTYYKQLEYIEAKDIYGNLTFCVDQNTLTLHSPDIEFDSELQGLYVQNMELKLKSPGVIKFSGMQSDIHVETSTSSLSTNNMAGAFCNSQKYKARERYLAGYTLSAMPGWVDTAIRDTIDFEPYNSSSLYNYILYPWHSAGSLNNDKKRPADKGAQSAVLKTKILANMHFSDSNSFFTDPVSSWGSNNNPKEKIQTKLFLRNNNASLKLPYEVYDYESRGYKTLRTEIYLGDVDTLLYENQSRNMKPDTKSETVGILDDMPITSLSTTVYDRLQEIPSTLWVANPLSNAYVGDSASSQAQISKLYLPNGEKDNLNIRMRYRSNNHIVVSLPKYGYYNRNIQIGASTYAYNVEDAVLPSFGFINRIGGHDYIQQQQLQESMNPSSCYLFLGELYRDPDPNDFSGDGNTESAKLHNVWLPAGSPVKIGQNSFTLNYEWGDTWYQRFDCVKTYPYSEQDENQIIEVASFLCETRVNADGRYDTNRGLQSYINIDNEKFNLWNPVYSQRNNFFTYKRRPDDYYKINTFSTALTWSGQKQYSSDIDSWTQLNFETNIYLDGRFGGITSLNTFGNKLLCFQEHGLSLINFNSRVQIPTGDITPIELSNNYKVDGYTVISESLGTNGPWTTCISPGALYFIDNYTNYLYSLDSELKLNGVYSGMSTWFMQAPKEIWNAELGFPGMKLLYENKYNDLYIVTADEALTFSELLGNYTSFMSYDKVQAFCILGNKPIIIRNEASNCGIYVAFAGSYNRFFNNYKPFEFTFISNDASSDDKIFTNIEIEGEVVSQDAHLDCPEEFFDQIQVWNTYQDTGVKNLAKAKALPSNLKKKFRTWRIDIPRDATHKLDRIRGQWAKLRLRYWSHDSGEGWDALNVLFRISKVSTLFYK